MSGRRWLNSTTMLSGVVGGVFLSTMTAGAQSLFFRPSSDSLDPAISGPAVDGFNWKAAALGGSIGGESLAGARGALTFPLNRQYGMQVDLQAGSLGGDGFVGIAGHLFWRNPGHGLLGLYVAHTHWSRFGGANVTHVAAEGEYYWQRWTLQGVVGVEFGNSATNISASASTVASVGAAPGVTTTTTFTQGYDVKTRFFDQINLKYYLQDNWAAYIGHRYLGGQNALALGTEWAFPVNTQMLASAFVEGRVGSGEFRGVWGGLKIYFGQHDKTLIQRHRQDDPGWWDTLQSILNNYFEHVKKQKQQFCDPPEVLVDGSCGSGET